MGGKFVEVVLSGIFTKDDEYMVEYINRHSNKQYTISLPNLLKHIECSEVYYITEWFQGMITPMGEEGSKLNAVIKSDLKTGKCLIIKIK